MDAALLDMTGGLLNIACKAGDDVAFILPTPADLSAWSWAADIRARADKSLPILGAFSFEVTSSQATCRIAGDVTALLPPASVYDLQVTLAGVKRTLLSGQIETDPDVTP